MVRPIGAASVRPGTSTFPDTLATSTDTIRKPTSENTLGLRNLLRIPSRKRLSTNNGTASHTARRTPERPWRPPPKDQDRLLAELAAAGGPRGHHRLRRCVTTIVKCRVAVPEVFVAVTVTRE